MSMLSPGFFQTSSLPADQLIGFYDPRLVLLSFLVAVAASFIALDFTARLRDCNNTKTSSLLWLTGGSVAMGAGIWSMHFIGMLSFTIPGLTLEYGTFWTVVSLFVAIVASAFALWLLKSSLINAIHLAAGGIVLGLGIASMHYTGMEAMFVTLNIKYLPALFLLSVLVAIIASEAAIWLIIKSNTVILRFRNRMKLVSAIIMGFAICGMHYTAMSASVFTPLCTPAVSSGSALNPTVLAMSIAIVTLAILGIALFASNYKEALNQEQFERARQLGMAEIAASVLHNVGNVLNSVNVSANMVFKKLSSSKLETFDQLCELLNKHSQDLAVFLTEDFQGKKIPEFMIKLNNYRIEEKKENLQEVNLLINNILLIRNIISTQQTFSKTVGIENVVLINELIEEALLIAGVFLSNEIKVVKKYEKINSIQTDRVKLIQILVNIFRNAKESLLDSAAKEKRLVITTYIDKEKVVMKISDNGVGVSSGNINKIFHHGFTTKKSGHGFGLHASALAINELGGEVQVESQGEGEGATFILTLPYKRPTV